MLDCPGQTPGRSPPAAIGIFDLRSRCAPAGRSLVPAVIPRPGEGIDRVAGRLPVVVYDVGGVAFVNATFHEDLHCAVQQD